MIPKGGKKGWDSPLQWQSGEVTRKNLKQSGEKKNLRSTQGPTPIQRGGYPTATTIKMQLGLYSANNGIPQQAKEEAKSPNLLFREKRKREKRRKVGPGHLKWDEPYKAVTNRKKGGVGPPGSNPTWGKRVGKKKRKKHRRRS